MVPRELAFKASHGLDVEVSHVVSEDSLPHEDPAQTSSSEPTADSPEGPCLESESHSAMSDSLRPMRCRVHGILQARMLECVAFPFSRGSSQPRDRTGVFCIAGGFFTNWATRVFVFVNPVISDLLSPSSFPATSAQSRCLLLPAENLSLGAGLSSTVRLIKTGILFSWKGRHYAFSARLPWR